MSEDQDFTLDARGVLRVSTSTCDRERSLLLAGYDPDDVAVRYFGTRPEAFQSPLALVLGRQFEHGLYRDDAKKLLAAYVDAGRLPKNATVVDLTSDKNRVQRTRQFVEARLRGEKSPDLILQGSVTLEAFGAPQSVIRPDILVAERDRPLYRPGEVKSYESRDGYTSEQDIESSAAQAAVALLALSRIDPRYGEGDSYVDIILRRPSSMNPAIHPIPASRDLHRLRIAAAEDHGFVETLARLHACASDDAEFRREVDAMPTLYEPACLQRCGFAHRCRKKARDAGDPRAIDPSAVTLLSGSLDTLLQPESLGDSYEARMLRDAIEAIDEAMEDTA